MQKEPYALPAQYIMDCTRYVTASPIAKTCVWQILWIMWREGFTRALSDLEIKRASGLSVKSWARYSEDIKAILGEVLPMYLKYYVKRNKITKINRINMQKALEVRIIKQTERKQMRVAKTAMSDDSLPRPSFLPLPEKREWHEGMSDLHERNAIRKAEKPSAKKQFTDK